MTELEIRKKDELAVECNIFTVCKNMLKHINIHILNEYTECAGFSCSSARVELVELSRKILYHFIKSHSNYRHINKGNLINGYGRCSGTSSVDTLKGHALNLFPYNDEYRPLAENHVCNVGPRCSQRYSVFCFCQSIFIVNRKSILARVAVLTLRPGKRRCFVHVTPVIRLGQDPFDAANALKRGTDLSQSFFTHSTAFAARNGFYSQRDICNMNTVCATAGGTLSLTLTSKPETISRL